MADIFGHDLPVSCHVAVYDHYLGKYYDKGKQEICTFKSNFFLPFLQSIQEGELEVKEDCRHAATKPTTVSTLHCLWFHYSIPIFCLFMQLLIFSLMDVLHLIIIIKLVMKWCRRMLNGAKQRLSHAFGSALKQKSSSVWSCGTGCNKTIHSTQTS